jgi:hypothetical protein
MKKKSVRVLGEIIDADGSVVATSSASGLIEWRDKRTFKYSFELGKARLWSPETPYQYTMRTHVYCGARETDVSEVKFGCRTIRVDADEGLFINDKKYLIKGVCVHENCGLTGKFVPDNIHRHKVELLKQMGANGYRTAHYPHSEAMMDALDENGFIVMDETRWFDSSDEGKAQLEMLIKLGHRSTVNNIVLENCENTRLIDWSAKKPWELFRLTRKEYNRWGQGQSWSRFSLDVLKIYKRMGGNGERDFAYAEELDKVFAESELMTEFLKYAERGGVTPTKEDLRKSEEVIMTQIRAYIGRNALSDESGYYYNIYPIDDVMQRAVKELKHGGLKL